MSTNQTKRLVYIGVGTVQLVNARIEKNKVLKATWDAVSIFPTNSYIGTSDLKSDLVPLLFFAL